MSRPARNPRVDKDPGPFREGDRVRLLWGYTEVEGTVVEDRGPLGGGGRRLYGVRFRVDDVSPPLYTELPPEELTLVARDGQPGSTDMVGYYEGEYQGHKWIKVKHHEPDPNKSWEERYKDLEKHHVEETSFLIEEVRKLAKLLDQVCEEHGYP